jgi:starvation-inducible outer membrane lipoprotein
MKQIPIGLALSECFQIPQQLGKPHDSLKKAMQTGNKQTNTVQDKICSTAPIA